MWLRKYNDIIAIGIRSLLNFSDIFDICETCQNRVAGEETCPFCNCYYHFQCKKKACIKCNNPFQ